jgi:drug/metabolite transporter (DMT)-like permease
MYIALTGCAASIYQMMRGIIVVITASLSVLVLKRKQYCHHWTSLLLIVIGVFIVGVVGILESNKGDEKSSTFLSIILLLMSQVFISLQLISEEMIIEGY